MNPLPDQIIRSLQTRYATDIFDTTRQVSDEDLYTILESGRLAPSSFGLEPWQFIVVDNPELRAKIRVAAWNQGKVTDAARLVVIARRINTRDTIVAETATRIAQERSLPQESLSGFQKMVSNSIATRTDEQLDDWNARQTYIPLGMMLETAALLGINNTAMEGFNSAVIDEILGLKEKQLATTTMLALGYMLENDERASWKKVRRPFDEVVTFVK